MHKKELSELLKVTKNNVPAILANIEALIAEQCESKTQFYSESGVSSSLYSQWNTGGKIPSLRSLSKICDYFDVTLDALINGDMTQTIRSEDDIEVMRLRELIRERPDIRLLLKAIEDAPQSEVLSVTAQIMKYKEQNQ